MGLYCTVGIGENMLQSKLCLDLEAKKAPSGIARWHYEDIPTKLWPVSPLSKMWGIGGRMERNLNRMGMPRFFRRLAEGVFDEEDLVFHTKELNEFLDEAAKTYGFDRENVVAIGYSNGANIAASLLFHYQNALKGAILHHPMVPRRGINLPDLSDKAVFIAAGTNDPICSPMESGELQSLLEKAHANVEIHWEDRGHQLTAQEVEAAAIWYRKLFIKQQSGKIVE
jgi:phospholipase/carboxylesterase